MNAAERFSRQEPREEPLDEQAVALDPEGAEEIVPAEPEPETAAETLGEIRSRLKKLVEEARTLSPRTTETIEKAPEPERSGITTPFPPVNEFMHSPGWSAYRTFNAQTILVSDPIQPDIPAPIREFRTHLFDVIRESGIGPAPGETLEAFITRASGRWMGSESIARPQVVETTDHTFVVRGGDFQARSILAKEYAQHVNPGAAHVYVESPGGGGGEYLDYAVGARAGGELKAVKLTPQLGGANVVF